MSRAAAAKGFDTVIFLKHKDNTNYPCGKEKQVDAKYMNVEVVAVKLKGTYACGTKQDHPSKDVLRAGWHSKQCDCSNHYDDSNCGRVLRSVFPLRRVPTGHEDNQAATSGNISRRAGSIQT